MAYGVRANIAPGRLDEETLVQLTDDHDVGIVNEVNYTKARSDADAEIDIYCDHYDLPFSPVPVIIAKLSDDITVYNLYRRRLGAPENIERDYNNAIKLLTNISKGTVSLGADAPDEVASGDAVAVSSSDRVFSRDTLENY